MELIYTNAERQALGQLSSFDIDYDATGEKDFELTIDRAILKKGYWIFIQNTEIGGIVDSVTSTTENHEIKYIGRNFRGILHNKIIDVPREQSYISAQGNLTDVINELLINAQLDCFVCKEPKTDNVESYVDYAFQPFCTLYDGIMGLAQSINFKLVFSYNAKTNKVEITPMISENYTDILTYTKNYSVNLELQDNSMSTNHFVLVGYNDDKRYKIDLYVNDDAQLMNYASVQNPIKDSQYILDNRYQCFFGVDEKTTVEITDSINPIENYEFVSQKPKDWVSKYNSYYQQKTESDGDDVNVDYEPVEPKTTYMALNSQPSDWVNNYASYFKLVDGEYQGIDSVTTTSDAYKKVKKKPKSWRETYQNYYYRQTDGLTYFYNSISGVSKDYYTRQKYRPTDWNNNYNQYYQVGKKNGKTIYEAVKGEKAPKWQKYKYFTKTTKTFAPKFNSNVYVKIKSISTESAPTFYAGEVYKKYEVAPFFMGCYKKVYDHYGGMINALLDKLELFPSNEQEVSLVDFEADIGDVVGGYDSETNITLSAPITNIIYRIERGIQRSIEYVIGG